MRKFTATFLMFAAVTGTLAVANLCEAGRGGGGGGGRSAGRSAPVRYAPATQQPITAPVQSHIPPVADHTAQTPSAGDKTAPKTGPTTPANPSSKDPATAKTSKQQKNKQKKQSGAGGGGGGEGDGDGDDGDDGSGGGSFDAVEDDPSNEDGAAAAPVTMETGSPAPADAATSAANATDVELVEVRCVDAGNAAKDQGPAFRVWFRNNSQVAVGQSFRVAVLASLNRTVNTKSPQAVVVVKGMKAGEVLAVDVRLPARANSLARNIEGRALPFAFLVAAVDCYEELNETNRDNNVTILGRLDIPMVEDE